MSEELKPCPFCGGEAIVEHEQECRDAETYFWFVCGGCGCETEGEHGRESAAAAWNRRASAPPQEGVREKVRAAIEANIDSRLAGPREDYAEVVGIDEAVDAVCAILSSLRGEGAAS